MPADSPRHTRSTTAGCARYVGRIGSLAVALGIGAAVATGFGIGVAQADDTGTSDTSPSADSPTGDSPAGDSPAADSPTGDSPTGDLAQQTSSGGASPADADTAKDDDAPGGMNFASSGGPNTSDNDEGQSTDVAADDENSDDGADDDEGQSTDVAADDEYADDGADDEQDSDLHDFAASVARSHGSLAANTPPAGQNPSLSASVTTAAANPEPTRTLSSNPLTFESASSDPQGFTTVSTMQESQVVLTTKVAPDPEPASTTTVITTFVSTVLAPLLNPGPGTPVDPPMVLGLLAWVRSEEQRRYSTDTFFAGDQLSNALLVDNSAPVAVKDGVTTREDTPVTVKVLANDKDADGDAITAALATGPANGTITANTNGSFTYTPNANFNGTDTFTYTVNDGTTDSTAATVIRPGVSGEFFCWEGWARGNEVIEA
ncbi:MAG: cadherin-like domain-containing protein, partial [Mycobacteriaceae bacterium]|nr:cadherin-like domain-containing protein [Mycobacteriaceae bacterium]